MSAIKNKHLSLTTRARLFDEVTKLLTANPSKKYYLNVTERPKKRSLSANAQQHVWYKQISEATATDIKTVEAECKIDFGLPIILDDAEVGAVLSYSLEKTGFFRMTREQQVKMAQVIQVTSLMSTAQHSQYRDNIMHFWQQAGVNIGYEE